MGFATVTWTGESKPTWCETFEGEAKRGFCPTCGSRVAAIDSDIPETGINVTALDDTSGTDLCVSRALIAASAFVASIIITPASAQSRRMPQGLPGRRGSIRNDS
ncbi:hypothetical protein [Streptomyces sp. NPDC052036]|uniref:hypothetical protein n=1 Tax=unclassified Streptomyces TaxID=2593676 RepID=UPI0034203779